MFSSERIDVRVACSQPTRLAGPVIMPARRPVPGVASPLQQQQYILRDAASSSACVSPPHAFVVNGSHRPPPAGACQVDASR